jgi:hypothetical protein
MVLALNTVSGQISDVSPKMLKHPHFSKYLVAVDNDAIPYIPEMHRGGTVEEKTAQKQTTRKRPKGAKAPKVKETPKPYIDIEDEN